MPRVFETRGSVVTIEYGVVGNDGQVISRVGSWLMNKAEDTIRKAFDLLASYGWHFTLGDVKGNWMSDEVASRVKGKASFLLYLVIPFYSVVSVDSSHTPYEIYLSLPHPEEKLLGITPETILLRLLAEAMFARIDPEYELAKAVNAAGGQTRPKDIPAVL